MPWAISAGPYGEDTERHIDSHVDTATDNTDNTDSLTTQGGKDEEETVKFKYFSQFWLLIIQRS